MIGQGCCRPRHLPRAAQRAEAAPLAAEGHQLVVPAVAAAQPQEAVGQAAALRKASNSPLTNCGRSAPAAASAC